MRSVNFLVTSHLLQPSETGKCRCIDGRYYLMYLSHETLGIKCSKSSLLSSFNNVLVLFSSVFPKLKFDKVNYLAQLQEEVAGLKVPRY